MNQFATSTVTTAGFALALGLLGAELWQWWKGGSGGGGKGKAGAPAEAGGPARDPKALIPLVFGIVFGILMVGCPSGALGKAGSVLRWGGNGAGGAIMGFVTGQDGAEFAQATAPRLDEYGAVLVTALVIALWIVRKKIPKLPKGKWKKGVFIGLMLCISTGTAALVAQTVIGGTNDLGRQAFGIIKNADLGDLA
ncbi:hypothetical protein [Streptomyces rubradiris]|uniref:Sulphur transport domain-containing protein n=1 Tax=Streptomyces rubradiris TaxID=285531 RepID=A0ABQ3R3J1_STRRR|nr:hypothetical protein [Streptomyces rubradiris]GHH30154.1 hypothetical protein GCM10018792_76260 [Streptomyces rubradiris]GHI50407.1 hypothetical protein Srubr_02530 [Streptomyces rubradiris]